MFNIKADCHLFPSLFSNIRPAADARKVLVAVTGELDVVGGVGGVRDLLEVQAAGCSLQSSERFSYQVLVICMTKLTLS